MKRTLNTTIDRSKNDEFYTQYTLIFSLCGAAPLRETTLSYDIDGNRISGDLQGTGVGGLLYLTVNDSVYIPFYDNNGNITRYLDSTDETVATYTYDAFGNTISQSGSLANIFRHRFSTKYFDTETDLYYYGYRFYHPFLMRWLNRDPIEEDGGVNLYAFCGNYASGLYDGLGLFTIHIHTDELGHVGISNKAGTTFDYGRYHGKYKIGFLGKFNHSGPNIQYTNQRQRS